MVLGWLLGAILVSFWKQKVSRIDAKKYAKTSGQFESFGDHFGTLHLTKTIQKQIVFFIIFQKQLGHVWERFWKILGSILGSCRAPFASKNQSKKGSQKNTEKSSKNGPKMGPKMGPKSDPDGPKKRRKIDTGPRWPPDTSWDRFCLPKCLPK